MIDLTLILGLGISLGEGNGYPVHYSYPVNSMDRGAWRATIHGFTKETDTMEQPTLSLLLLFWHSYQPDENDMEAALEPRVRGTHHAGHHLLIAGVWNFHQLKQNYFNV